MSAEPKRPQCAMHRRDLHCYPVAQFRAWYDAFCAADVSPEPSAMQLASVSASGQPSVRTVLLKAYGADGFVFYTNLHSAKARDIADNRRVSLLFFWVWLDRQIRIDGDAHRANDTDADAYFASRHRVSQIGAWASQQSSALASRAQLDAEYARYEERFAGQDVPRPPHWGGYRVVPRRFEFWQGQTARLHDRLVYRRHGHDWQITRLAP